MQLSYLQAYMKCQDGNPHPGNPLPEVEDLKGCPPECKTEAGARFLWEDSVIKTQGDCETTGRITIWQVISFRHTERGHADPRLAVILRDDRTHGHGRYNDISDTPVGQLFLAGWKTQYPDVYADLPRTHAEMVQRIKELSLRVMIEEIEEAGISTTGLSDDELYKKSPGGKHPPGNSLDAQGGVQRGANPRALSSQEAELVHSICLTTTPRQLGCIRSHLAAVRLWCGECR